MMDPAKEIKPQVVRKSQTKAKPENKTSWSVNSPNAIPSSLPRNIKFNRVSTLNSLPFHCPKVK
jgi:hypothetical protein